MTENERKTENAAEYTFINRNTRRKSEEEDFGGEIHPSQADYETEELPEEPFDGENGRTVPERFAAKPKKPLRSVALVLAVQTALAALLIAGAAVIRLIGGETAQQITRQYYQLTESGAVDLKGLFAPIAPESEASSGAEPTESIASGKAESDSFASEARSVPEQEAPVASEG
ncbi:MAG: hypothetical protein ACOYJR_09710 [Acutalibacteraceae bacterium]|jgi:hypothetical protein